MKRISISEARANLSRYLKGMTQDEAVLICKRNEPVAELRLLLKKSIREPRIGAAKGLFTVPDSFFEPLTDEIPESLAKPIA